MNKTMKTLTDQRGFAIFGAVLVLALVTIIGIAAIIGGVYALQRRIWAFALAGSILSCMVFPIFGLPAIIITVIARDEFS